MCMVISAAMNTEHGDERGVLRVRVSNKRIREGFIKKMTSAQRYEGGEGAAMGKSAPGRGDQRRALPSRCGFSSLHISGTAFFPEVYQ